MVITDLDVRFVSSARRLVSRLSNRMCVSFGSSSATTRPPFFVISSLNSAKL